VGDLEGPVEDHALVTIGEVRGDATRLEPLSTRIALELATLGGQALGRKDGRPEAHHALDQRPRGLGERVVGHGWTRLKPTTHTQGFAASDSVPLMDSHSEKNESRAVWTTLPSPEDSRSGGA